MLGMNVGLDVRVIDQIGLANPLAAHTARLEDGRIGHDKNLFPDWAVAEGPFLKTRQFLPPYIDEDWIAQAEAALECPATDAMLNSVRGPMGPRRFLSNLLHAYQFTQYRIDRVPLYELDRCGLDVPEPTGHALHRHAGNGALASAIYLLSGFSISVTPPPRGPIHQSREPPFTRRRTHERMV